MRTLRAAVSVIAASLLSPLLSITPASAAPQWTPPEAFDSSRFGVDIAVNEAGAAVALWSAGDGVLKASYRPAGQNWGAPEVVARDLYTAQVFIDQQGVATAVDISGSISVIERRRDGVWKADPGVPTYQGVAHCGYASYGVDSDAVGNIVFAWSETECEGWRSRSGITWRFADGSWGPVHEQDGELLVEGVTVTKGLATLVGYNGTSTRGVWMRTSTMGSELTAPETLLEAVGVPAIASNARGDIVVGVAESVSAPGNNVSRLVVRTKPAGQEWQPAQAFPWADGSTGAATVAISEDGTTAAAYERTTSTRNEVLASVGRVERNQWSEPRSVSGHIEDRLGDTDVAAERDGSVVVAWSSENPQQRRMTVEASHRAPGQDWASPVKVFEWGSARWGQPVKVVSYPNGMFTAAFAEDPVHFSDFVDDTVPPTTRMVAPRRDFVSSTRIPVRWRATDDLARVRNIDVRVRSASRSGGFSAWSTWRRRTTDESAPFAGEPGRTYCFSARARDRVGNLGAWSPERCAATPVDDRALQATPAWMSADARSAYRGTLTITQQAGARLRLDDVTARTLRLVAGTCPSCGKVRVTHAGRHLGVFDLRSRRAKSRQVIVLGEYRSTRRGRLSLRVVTGGKPVSIDGIVASR